MTNRKKEVFITQEIIKAHGRMIEKCPLFCGMNAQMLSDALQLLNAGMTQYRRGESLHCSATPMPFFGLVLSGSVIVCTDDIEGNKSIMAEVRPGNTFGEALSLLHIPDAPVYIQATEPCRILWLSTAPLTRDAVSALQNELVRRFSMMLARRTLSMNSRIQILSKLRLREKLICYFSELSHEQNSATVRITMSREDMAAYMGTNRSALSRELSNMKKEGLIDYRKNIYTLTFPNQNLF